MDFKSIVIVLLTWLWQTTTTFAILLLAGLLGMGLVNGLQISETQSSAIAPAIVSPHSAPVDKWHPDLRAAGGIWRSGRPRNDVSAPRFLIGGSHVQSVSFDKE
jgi:hypothetical protein